MNRGHYTLIKGLTAKANWQISCSLGFQSFNYFQIDSQNPAEDDPILADCVRVQMTTSCRMIDLRSG